MTSLNINKATIFYILSFFIAVSMMVMSYDWGPSNDEKFNIPYADLSLDYYSSFGSNDTVLTTTTKMDPVMKHYAIVTELPAHVLHRITGKDLFQLRHLFIAFFSFFYIFFGALIAKKITNSWNAAYIAMAFLILTPRIFGEAMNNPKDPTYCATSLASLYCFYVFLDALPKPSWRKTLILLLGISISVIIRISGLISDFLFVIFLIWESYVLKKQNIEFDIKDLFKKVFVALGGGYLLGIIFWPAMINSPISQPFEALKFLKNLPVTVKNLFEGKYLQSTDIPWYYLPKYFLISNPEIILIGIFAGFVFIFSLKKKYNLRRIFFLLISGLFPLFLIIYGKTGLLTGWRHGYFIYIPLVVFSAIFFHYFIFDSDKKKSIQRVLLAILIIALMPTAYFMAKNYPLFYVYFNPSFGGVKKAMGNYELDYYSHSLKPATDWVIANEPNIKNLKLASNNAMQVNAITKAHGINNDAAYIRYRERYDTDWDYALMSQSFIDAEYLKNGYFPPKGTVKSIEVDGTPICAIIKREDKNDYYAKRLIDSGKFSEAIPFLNKALQYDPNNEIAWANLALAQLQTNQANLAVESANKCLSISPESIAAQNYLGYAYLQSGNTSNAQYVFLQMIEQNPGMPEPYRVLAQIYQQQGNAQAAQQYMSAYQQITGGR